MADSWLTSLLTDTPEDGFNLAVKISRVSIKTVQPDEDVRNKLRPVYANDTDGLIASSQVIAMNFQTVAAANNYWKS